MKYYYRLKGWLQARRYRIEGIAFDSLDDGTMEVSVKVGGVKYRINNIKHLEGTFEQVTDYGIYVAINDKHLARQYNGAVNL